MKDFIEDLKQRMGFIEEAPKCSNCRFFRSEDTTDNFGVGDLCTRNPDSSFKVKGSSYCSKWSKLNNLIIR